MVKCDICGRKVVTTFLGKIVGTMVYDTASKKRYVCKDCQREKTMDEIKQELRN